MWIAYAFLSAIFAALTAILAKAGVSGINSDLATAVRTTFILLITWSIVWIQQTKISDAFSNPRTLVFLILSACATGLSWLFYFRALQAGPVSRVISIDKLSLALTVILSVIIFHEKPTLGVILGVVLMSIGALVISLG